MANQGKGQVSFVYGGIAIKGLAEGSLTYEIGELGDTIPASDVVVHIKRNKAAVVSAVTANIVKGTAGLNDLLLLIQSEVNVPLTINDTGMGTALAMPSANATRIAIGDSSGASDVEIYSFTFKGNLNILSLEG